ncbi:glycoside hydrolase family 47 protein [Heterobasidion irregulare TC 32-1]|uniref:alpha-1,2-Mannosidase n=1 Tax=Heterobasidion irregulare (strain TC 32-1) TaxID=747525 RepID=W4K139_HETIT|nr:glycoside hydrolase family 47 protein [Heterobasidion irregulare TC 32-1]ETW78786.1 glycoside hydrolase family 47 protein [Heterobasidion irregulare TC 32-1]
MLSSSSRNVLIRKSIAVRYLLLSSTIIIILWTFHTLISSSHSPPRPVKSAPRKKDDLTYVLPKHPPRPKAWSDAAEGVKQAFLHAYHGYDDYAAPFDELLPMSRKGSNSFNGWGVTVYDSLDTMFLMNLTDEFDRAVSFVAKADFSIPFPAPFFETVIRYLGGLLSAYALSGNHVLLQKADDLGRLLSPAFGSKSGLPFYSVNTVTGVAPANTHGCLAEIASCQPEYTYLAKVTGNKTYYDQVAKVMETLSHAATEKLGGMLPVHWKLDIGRPIDTKLAVGGEADSAHEYLLKQFLLTGKTDKTALEMYLRTTTHILTHMLYTSPNRGILYPVATSGEPPHDTATHVFEHLACFLPGLFALGAHTLPLDDLPSLADYQRLAQYKLSDVHRWAARGLGEACAVLYADQPTGLSPDEAFMQTDPRPILWVDELDNWSMGGRRGRPPNTTPIKPAPHVSVQHRGEKDYGVRRAGYELRPEVIESLYILWRTTGETHWREYGWDIFQSIEQSCKTDVGYAALLSVEYFPPARKDSMPSYFMAETLKYLYLLFTDEDLVPLDKWVFNTEAHPLPVFSWSDEEKIRFGIA